MTHCSTFNLTIVYDKVYSTTVQYYNIKALHKKLTFTKFSINFQERESEHVLTQRYPAEEFSSTRIGTRVDSTVSGRKRMFSANHVVKKVSEVDVLLGRECMGNDACLLVTRKYFRENVT